MPSAFVAAKQIQQGSIPAIVAMLSSSHLAYGCFVISSTPSSCFVSSPHPLATVTVFPRPCGPLGPLKHGLHSYFGATPRRAFSSAAHCFCGLTVRHCGHSLCVLNFSRFLARLCGWCGTAALPCFSTSPERRRRLLRSPITGHLYRILVVLPHSPDQGGAKAPPIGKLGGKK